MRAHTYVDRCQPCTMRWYFEGSVYWDKLAEICSDISRAVGFRGAVKFEEIQYNIIIQDLVTC